MWTEEREQGWREGGVDRVEESYPRAFPHFTNTPRQMPLTSVWGTILPWPHFSEQLCWRLWRGVLGQASAPTAKSRVRARQARPERHGRTEQRVPSGGTSAPLRTPWRVCSVLGRSVPRSEEKSQEGTERAWPPRQGACVPDKLQFYEKIRDTDRPGSQSCGLGL